MLHGAHVKFEAIYLISKKKNSHPQLNQHPIVIFSLKKTKMIQVIQVGFPLSCSVMSQHASKPELILCCQ